MLRNLYAALAGGLFGAGLMVSGMTDTAKVQGWLDVFGNWDPTLAFVLGGAILPMAVAWRIAAARRVSALGTAFPPRPDPHIDCELAIGSLLFGMGWGLVGLCPGPALASLGYSGWGGGLFLLSMCGAMLIVPHIRGRLNCSAAPA